MCCFVIQRMVIWNKKEYAKPIMRGETGGDLKPEAFIDREQRILANLEQALTSCSEQDDSRIRKLVWRIGEVGIRSALPQLYKLLGHYSTLTDYCVAWALGRIKDPESFGRLEQLYAGTESDSVRRIALEAMLATAGQAQRDKLLEPVQARVKQFLGMDKLERMALVTALGQLIDSRDKGISALLDDLYLLALRDPDINYALLDALKTIPLHANYFRAIRHLIKAAEFRLDAATFGLLAYRIETTPSPFSRFAWEFEYIRLPDSDEYVQFDQEITSPDSRIAYSDRTRDYLRRRICRVLRRFGELEHPRYVDFAVQILLQYRDEMPEPAGEAPPDPDFYGPYASHLGFNQILYRHSKAYRPAASGRVWKRVDAAEPEPRRDLHALHRTEDCAALWDKNPEALFYLLQQSDCTQVQRFAARALLDHRDYCSAISLEALEPLLCSRFELTAQLAFEIVNAAYPGQDRNKSIMAVLRSSYAPAREQGKRWLEQASDILTVDSQLLVALLTSAYADIRHWGMALIGQLSFDNDYVLSVIKALFDYLQNQQQQSEQIDAVVTDLGKALNGVFSEHVKRLEIRIVADLLEHPLKSVQATGGQIILGHGVSAEFLPVKVFRSLMEAESEVARDVGLQLFKSLPDPPLLKQPEMLSAFCLSEHAEVRNSARQRVRTLAAANTGFGTQVVEYLTPQLLKKEKHPGFHQRVISLLKHELEAAARASDINAVWQLLFSPAGEARQLGAFLLTRRSAAGISVAHWATLADHELESVRRWAIQAYEQHPEQVKANAAEAIRILDSRWPATREFAMAFFLKHFGAREWTPNILIAVCDSVHTDIQVYAQELMLDFFQQGQGVEYLMKLSQHPSVQTKTFVSRFLSSFAADNPHRLQSLYGYFVGVLSMVNQGRQVKSMVLRFLQEEGLKSEDSARVIAPVLARQSLTSVSRDKEAILEIMTEFALRYPQIELPIAIKTQTLCRHGDSRVAGEVAG